MATASLDGTTILWDVTDPAAPRPLGSPLTGHTGWVNAVAFAPDGRMLATASFDGTTILWDLTDPAAPRPLGSPLTGHTGSVNAVAFTPDGRTLATASNDGTALLWDLGGLTDLRDHAIERACVITGDGLDRAHWYRYVPTLAYIDVCGK
jgi:WD40 repeat protein